MTSAVVEEHGVTLLECAADGPALAGEQEALDLIGDALGNGAEWIVIPVSRLTPDFFTLRTGVAGAIIQKFVNYRLRAVVVGDIGPQVEASTALRDFVRESNRGRQLWFVADRAELAARLSS